MVIILSTQDLVTLIFICMINCGISVENINDSCYVVALGNVLNTTHCNPKYAVYGAYFFINN